MPPQKGVHCTTRLLSTDLCVMKGHKQTHLFENDKKLQAIG
jgi:hypothetical protein